MDCTVTVGIRAGHCAMVGTKDGKFRKLNVRLSLK